MVGRGFYVALQTFSLVREQEVEGGRGVKSDKGGGDCFFGVWEEGVGRASAKLIFLEVRGLPVEFPCFFVSLTLLIPYEQFCS